MDFEEKKRRQLVRVIIAEIGMVLSVLLIVIVAIMAAMGFFITDGGKIEQSGLMQIHSMPTGATVELDGATLFSRTNLSRTMSAGAHHLRISRAGYDTWENDLEMYSGVLIRLYYPRLFLLDRKVELVSALTEETEGLEFYTVSRSRNYVLYAESGKSDWHLLDVKGDVLKETTLDLSGILPGMVAEEKDVSKLAQPQTNSGSGVVPKYRFVGEIKDVQWSLNDEKVLVLVANGEKEEWVLVNLRNVENSLNLTAEFGLDFEHIEMIDDAANQLFALENRHLRKINAPEGAISKVLVDGVEEFVNYGSNVLYVAKGREQEKIVATYRDGENGGTTVAKAEANDSLKIALTRYYDEDYICWTVNDRVNIIYGTIPSYRDGEADLSKIKTLVNDAEVGFTAEWLDGRSGSGYILMWSGKKVLAVELNMGEARSYEIGSPEFGWIDEHMLYTVDAGQITVWDYDGANMRNLSTSRAGEDGAKEGLTMDLPVMIASNDRYLYYLVDDSGVIQLAREKIRD